MPILQVQNKYYDMTIIQIQYLWYNIITVGLNFAVSDEIAHASAPSGEWVSIALTQIGRINMHTTNIQTFHLPSSIPTSASQVL